MLDEVKIIDKNHKGTISISNELLKKVIFSLANYNSDFPVKNIEIKQTDEISKPLLVIEFKNNKNLQLYGNLVVDYLKKLNLSINLNLNASNYNIVLVYN